MRQQVLGDDTLDAAAAADSLIGGTGNDTFVVYTGTEHITTHSGNNTLGSRLLSA